MFMEERHQKIIEMIKLKERVEVQELSEIFNVSEDTIRRDLRIMEKQGSVHRTYGGAILPQKVSFTAEFLEREKIQTVVKEEIASLAASFIQDNDTILLDGSTTVAKIVPFLSKLKNITVITNSIAIAYEIITDAPAVKLFIIGGMIRNDIANAISSESLLQIQQFCVDKVFIGACTISPDYELSNTIMEEASMKRAMLEAGREVYIMADSSKFGQKSLVQVGRIKPGYNIITDDRLPADIKEELNGLIGNGLKISSHSTKA